MGENKIKAVVLAAGKGTRLQSESAQLPKVMRLAEGRPLLSYVLGALRFIKREDTILVVGYMREAVEATFPDYPTAVQDRQLGTGHAVMAAASQLESFDGTVLVCYGDMPLLPRRTYEALIAAHEISGSACTMLSARCDLDLPYGRIKRDENGAFLRVVEERDCTDEEKLIRELNVGVCAFDCKKLLSALTRLRTDNAQGEYYLTDVPEILREDGDSVCAYCAELGMEILGVNTPEQLAAVEEYIRSSPPEDEDD